MKVLITGATGFLGRHLTKMLTAKGWEIFISNTSKANLMSDKNLHIYNDKKFDYIFHLAAHTKAGDYCLHHKGEQFEINQRINSNILKYWNDKQPQAKMVAMGTSCSYSPELPMKEDNYLKGDPEEGLYTYAMTKRMLLVGLKSYAEQYGLKWVYFVPSTLYGSQFEEWDNHFIFDFIKNCYQAKFNNKKFVVWGDGTARRELIYVEDACELMLSLLGRENEIFNLGGGKDHSINDFAKYVCEGFDYDYELIERDLSKYVGVKSKLLNIDKISDYKLTPLNEGLQKTIKWYIENHDER
jgi:GDP-L-fucose synthase